VGTVPHIKFVGLRLLDQSLSQPPGGIRSLRSSRCTHRQARSGAAELTQKPISAEDTAAVCTLYVRHALAGCRSGMILGVIQVERGRIFRHRDSDRLSVNFLFSGFKRRLKVVCVCEYLDKLISLSQF
jgi:hypothetical protein